MSDVIRLITMDMELERLLTSTRTYLNSGSELRLFIDDLTPAADDAIDDYTEPTFTGYALVDLLDGFTEPVKDSVGVWSMETEIFTYEITEALEEVELFGYFITKGGNLKYAERFPEPVSLEVGSQPLRLRLILRMIAASACPSCVIEE